MKTLQTLLITTLLATAIAAHAQVSINATGNVPNNSAMLDVSATNKGLLIPQVALTGTADATTIPTPANSLLVYNTATTGTAPNDVVPGYYYNAGTSNAPVWIRLTTGTPDGSETKVAAGANVTVTGTGTLASPYVISTSSGGTNAHYVGELFGGGIVFWVDNTGQHGLIVSLVNLGQAIWSSTYTTTGAVSTWDGAGNTAIIAGSPAAGLCTGYYNANYGTGCYGDWYLPAIDELSLIYHARYILNKNIEGVPGANIFALSYYWSSAEYGSGYAWSYYFGSGYAANYSKGSSYWVRAVRAF